MLGGFEKNRQQKSKRGTLLIDLIKKGQKPFKPYIKTGLYARDVFCSKKITLAKNTENTEMSVTGEYFTETGKSVEDTTIKRLTRAESVVTSNFKVRINELKIGGYIDTVIYDNDKLYVVEIKNVGSVKNLSPRYADVNQLKIYMAITGLPGILFYISRSFQDYDGELDAVEFHYENDSLDNIIYNAALGFEMAEAGIYTDKPEYMKKTYCSFCPFFNHCWNEKEVVTEQRYVDQFSPEYMQCVEKAQEFTEKYIENTPERKREIVKRMLSTGSELGRTLKGMDWENF